jgi:uncharacterized repeat protein (TIGR01451 family)
MNERSSIIDSDDPTEEEIPVAEAADTDGNQYPVWLELEVPEDPRIKSSVPAPVPVAKLSVSPRTQPLPSNPPLVYGLNAKVLLPRPAFGFRVEHSLPPGVKLLETHPKATVVGDHLIWNLGRLDPGREIRLQVVVQPEPDVTFKVDELTSFDATYSQNLHFETPLVRPKLIARFEGKTSVALGQTVSFSVEVRNSGNWPIHNVKAETTLPEGFAGDIPQPMVTDIGLLYPTEKRTITITTHGTQPGMYLGKVIVTGSEDTRAEAEMTVAVSM